jgi:hypothetical protein
MSLNSSCFFTILLVIGAIVFSGCTDSAPLKPSVITPQIAPTVIETATSPVATIARQLVTTAEIIATENPVRVFTGNYH